MSDTITTETNDRGDWAIPVTINHPDFGTVTVELRFEDLTGEAAVTIAKDMLSGLDLGEDGDDWGTGAATDCPVCNEAVAEGDDCPSEHYAKSMEAGA